MRLYAGRIGKAARGISVGCGANTVKLIELLRLNDPNTAKYNWDGPPPVHSLSGDDATERLKERLGPRGVDFNLFAEDLCNKKKNKGRPAEKRDSVKAGILRFLDFGLWRVSLICTRSKYCRPLAASFYHS